MTQATPYKQLRRPLDDRMVAGVCSGVARYANIDPILVRIAFVVLVLVTWGWALLAYPVMWLLMPEEPRPEAPAWRDPADPSWGRPAAGYTPWPGTPAAHADAAATPPAAPRPPAPPQPSAAPEPAVATRPTAVAEASAMAEPTVAGGPAAGEPSPAVGTYDEAKPPVGPQPPSA